jgi:hypothetical protein
VTEPRRRAFNSTLPARSEPMPRGKGFTSRPSWAPAAPLLSGSAKRPPARKNTGPSRKIRNLVLARDNWQCVGCGKPVGGGFTWWSMQHRKARGVGGDNSPCNLIVLCGSATSPGCHRLCEDRDREMHERGLWLRSDEDPAAVPVMIASEHGSGVTAWPTEDGRYVFEAPAGAA